MLAVPWFRVEAFDWWTGSPLAMVSCIFCQQILTCAASEESLVKLNRKGWKLRGIALILLSFIFSGFHAGHSGDLLYKCTTIKKTQKMYLCFNVKFTIVQYVSVSGEVTLCSASFSSHMIQHHWTIQIKCYLMCNTVQRWKINIPLSVCILFPQHSGKSNFHLF